MNAKAFFAAAFIASAVGLSGCSSDGNSSNQPSGHTVFLDSSLYSSTNNTYTSSVYGYFFPNSGTPSTTPSVTINGPANAYLAGAGRDSSGNIYALIQTQTNGNTTFAVNVYAPNSTSSSPSRTFTLSNVTEVDGGTVDASGNVYILSYDYVGNAETLYKFAASSTGNATPTATIVNPAFNNYDGYYQDLAVDSNGNLILVYWNGSNDVLAVFPAGFNASTVPTLVSDPNNNYYNVIVDSQGKIYAFGNLNGNPGIVVYTKGTTGYTVSQTITGSNTQFKYGSSIAVDTAGDIFVRTTANNPSAIQPHSVTPKQANSGNIILEFAASANGNVAPIASLTTNLPSNSQSDSIAAY